MSSVPGSGLPEWARSVRALVGTVRTDDLSTFVVEPQDRAAAVLIAFGPGEQDAGEVLLTQRAAHLRKHPSQVAFPGGSVEPGENAVQAALREAAEETQLRPAEVEVWGELPAVRLPVTSFAVVPVLAWWPHPHDLGWDPGETERAIRVPLPALLEPSARFTTRLRQGTGPAFETHDLFIWGFTAGLLARILQLAGLERPWDASVLRDIPPELRRPSATG